MDKLMKLMTSFVTLHKKNLMQWVSLTVHELQMQDLGVDLGVARVSGCGAWQGALQWPPPPHFWPSSSPSIFMS